MEWGPYKVLTILMAWATSSPAQASDLLQVCQKFGNGSKFYLISWKVSKKKRVRDKKWEKQLHNIDFLSYIFSVSEEYKDYTFDYDDMAG